ncbi:MAG TPA: tetratricopeptide repeat protein [Solirubrobacteraceae bacterium]|nr:tetratricopeptide repeat protein [Solirubrobacteraceae bacterium]
MGPLRRFRHWRGRRVWLRDPARALRLLGDDRNRLDAASASIRAWLLLTYARDPERAEEAARAALAQDGDTRFASATLAEVHMRRGEADAAIALLRAARAKLPDVKWYTLTLADVLEEAGRVPQAEAVLEEALADAELRRHALKRLSRLALERGDRARARLFFTELVALEPDYLVYASDYVTLGTLQLEDGDRDAARDTWRAGAGVYPRNAELRGLLAEHFGETPPEKAPNIPPVREEELGVRRIPVRTRMITARTGVLDVVEDATAEVRQEGDVVALAESAAAAGQGRLVPLELIEPGPLARLLSRFVGSIGPLHSAEGMQGAIMEAGRPRIVAGTVAAVVTKPFGRRGWFYRVAGQGTALIDDVAAALPPNDHHMVFGPRDPDGLAAELAARLSCGAAIVDANHLSGAWVVAASEGIDRRWLEQALNDNPAGNQDERTPVVIVRRTDLS